MGILDMNEAMQKAIKGMDSMPKCDRCGGHLAGGSMTFNDIHNNPATWCMKCVLLALTFYQMQYEKQLMNNTDAK